jgi:hypothetical protein
LAVNGDTGIDRNKISIGDSVEVADPDQDWIRIQLGLCIQIRIRNPDPIPDPIRKSNIAQKKRKQTNRTGAFSWKSFMED